MNTQEFTLTSQGLGMNEALDATEKLGKEGGLNEKNLMQLRLLAEELFGMLKSITGNQEAVYHAEQEGGTYRLVLNADVHMTQDVRENLLSVASSGTNEAAKGFMGSLKEMIAKALLPDDTQLSMLSLGVMSMGSPGGLRTGTGSYDWSLKKFRSEAEEHDEVWDKLEKSIVASIADDVTVSIEGQSVRITIVKAF